MALDDIVFEVEVEADNFRSSIKSHLVDGVPEGASIYINTHLIPRGTYSKILKKQPVSSEDITSLQQLDVVTSTAHTQKVELSLNDNQWQHLATNICHAQKVVLEQSTVHPVTLDVESSKIVAPLLFLSTPVLNYNDVETKQLMLDRQSGFIAGMYRNLFKVAIDQGYDYVVLPEAGLGERGGDPQLYFGILMALAMVEFPTLNIMYHPGEYKNQFNQALQTVGCNNVVGIHKDVFTVAATLRNKGYQCAVHNPVDEDLVWGATDLYLDLKSKNLFDSIDDDLRQTQSPAINERKLLPYALVRVELSRLRRTIEGKAGTVAFADPQNLLGDNAQFEEDKLKFDNLFTELRLKTDNLIEKGDPANAAFNPAYQKVALAAQVLCTKLANASQIFFMEPTERRRAIFKTYCEQAIRAADIDFAEHRGVWGKIHPIFKMIIGLVALLTVIPAIIVSKKSPHGCLETFFGNRQPDASEKLYVFKKGMFGEDLAAHEAGCHALH